MAETSNCVRHAILSLAATYVMDFERTQSIKSRANYHQREAIRHLGRELKLIETYDVTKGDNIIAALMLLSHNEVSINFRLWVE